MCANLIFQHLFNLDLAKIRTTSAYVCCFVFRPHCHTLLVMVTTSSFLNSSCDYLAHIARSATKSRHIGHLLWSKILLSGWGKTCNGNTSATNAHQKQQKKHKLPAKSWRSLAKVCCHQGQFTINSSHHDTHQSLVFPAFRPVFITITPPEKKRVPNHSCLLSC